MRHPEWIWGPRLDRVATFPRLWRFPSVRQQLRFGILCGVTLLATAAFSGCQHEPPPPPPAKPPEVFVAYPTQETVTDFEEFTGRTVAVNLVEIRARVTGYLEKTFFKDGSEVKEGDLLFEIDRRTYQAELDRNIALVAQYQARVDRLKRQVARGQKLVVNKAISEEEFDQMRFDEAEAEATLAQARASTDLAKLNLGFTRITSPISGRISRRLADPGNLIQADTTPLATIVSLDPIYVYFDVDERTVLRVRRLIREGQIQSARDSRVTVQLALADEETYSLSGIINFIDNQIDANTGTLRVRAVIDNPRLLLSPGLFVRLRYPIGEPHQALLVREESLGTDQGQRFVYVVNEKDEVAYRRVEVGLLTSGRRVIETGLESGERVIVSGLQRVRPGTKVAPTMFVEDSAIAAEDSAGQPAAAGKQAAAAPAPEEKTADASGNQAAAIKPVTVSQSAATPPAKPERPAKVQDSKDGGPRS